LEEAVKDAKKVIGDEKADKDKLEAAAKELNDKLMPIGAKMYEQSGSDSGGDGKDEADAKDAKKDDAVEGEVVDDKDSKKD
jgi:molecular chaperone DnaK